MIYFFVLSICSLLIACCVTHLYFQISIEQSVQECDATKASFLFYSLGQKKVTKKLKEGFPKKEAR